jgi:hypothetical protein
MDMSLDQPSSFKRFLRTWRREIIRGSVLFGIVVGCGLFFRTVTRNIKDHLPSNLGALGSFGDMEWGDGEGGNLFGHGRNVGNEWHYQMQMRPNQRVWIRNTNGPVDVVGGSNDSLEVHVEKSWRASDPNIVQLVPVKTELGVTICAVWEARETRCNEGGDYRMNGVRKNDVAVRFTVVLPKGIPIDASTINGGLQIDEVSAPVEANTVNGRIDVSTSSGSVHATTVNGSIDANMQELTNGDVRLTTVNGSVMAGLPKRMNAEIDAQTVNGRVDSDLPLKITGKMSTRHLHGTLGNGGSVLKLVTVNGSITIHEAAPMPPHAPMAPHRRVFVPRVKVVLPERP